VTDVYRHFSFCPVNRLLPRENSSREWEHDESKQKKRDKHAFLIGPGTRMAHEERFARE
jgi:hypothetical protein